MFPTFTGNSRRPRQVNLSSRNPNPFAKPDPWGKPSGAPGAGSQNAVVKAQQDRAARQQERERAMAAVSIQRTYRGYAAREQFKRRETERWDEHEGLDGVDEKSSVAPYASEEAALASLSRLLRFASATRPQDVERAQHFHRRLQRTLDHFACSRDPWPRLYLALQMFCLGALRQSGGAKEQRDLVSIVKFLAERSQFRTTDQALQYFDQVSATLQRGASDLDLIITPLRIISPATITAYEGFTTVLFTPHLDDLLRRNGTSLNHLADSVNFRLLGKALSELLKGDLYTDLKLDAAQQPAITERWVWLLAHFIYFYRHAHGFGVVSKYASDPDFLFPVSTILSVLVDHIEIESRTVEFEDDGAGTVSNAHRQVPEFVREQVNSLVSHGLPVHFTDGHSRVLASYILTLFRLFPLKSDEIRMWLYLGNSPSSQGKDHRGSPVVKFFWDAMRNTQIYADIIREPRAAINLLKPDAPITSRSTAGVANNDRQAEIDDQWRVILIFNELYSFVLKVMDDEEFFASQASSRQNALTLDEIREMTIFLKHLGFTMYYNASDILGTHEEEEQRNIASMFHLQESDSAEGPAVVRRQAVHVAGLHSMSLEYFKGLVTGVLRAIYERDSRRPFCPPGHWLMVERFDMTNFIEAVVEEEERRSKVQEEDDEEDETLDDVGGGSNWSAPRLVGTSHAQRIQRLENLQRQHRKASRKRYLQAVAPRLEILQNMPFLIPFTTRVQIFRQFVYLDKLKRRHGHEDPDVWRAFQSARLDPTNPTVNPLARHHANIRRGHEFEDAFEQFYDLGDNLKEPIQIAFYNQFGEREAGIDGGGVTKEFLTSVTNEVFSQTEEIPLFVENDQHLLYPNPSALAEAMELLSTTDQHDPGAVLNMLRRYDFLGRIIGKCLYESILVDIRFAPFFLLKWALTGGTGSAPMESGYRANLNDLRDLDEGLYQGLLQLKNYNGDVEDFALNFSITDTLKIPARPGRPSYEKNITKPLKPGGADEPVTQSNRLVYISYVARHRLSAQPARQTNSFLRGLSTMVQPSWLSMFNQSELQTLVGGAPAEIDVQDLRRNTIYGGIYVIGDDGLEHATVQLFWQVMHELDDEDRRAVVKFVTSTPRAPLLGFRTLTPRFSIRDSGNDDARLPSTSTCVNLLKLPRYLDKETLKQKLLQAVRSGAGFDLS